MLETARYAPPECHVSRPAAAPRVRPLDAVDATDLIDLLSGLDQPSRFSRFSSAMSDLRLVQHAQHALATSAFVAGAFVEDRLRGVVEVYDTGCSGLSEAAFVVAADWRRRGLGFALLQAASRWARQSERTTLRLVFSRQNWPMRQLAAKAGARFDLILDEIEADVAVDPALPAGQARSTAM
jgi:GNAT superfamily N-acetyltransferase